MSKPPPPVDDRIASARARLAANLGELQQRVTRARKLVSPRTYLGSPWLKLGVGVAIGYLVGRRRSPRLLGDGGAAPAPVGRRLVKAALRAAVTSLAGPLLERALARATRPVTAAPADDELEAPDAPAAPSAPADDDHGAT